MEMQKSLKSSVLGLFTKVRFAAPLGNLRSSENDEGQISANPVINDTLAQAMPVSHNAQSHKEQGFTRSHGDTELGFCAVVVGSVVEDLELVVIGELGFCAVDEPPCLRASV